MASPTLVDRVVDHHWLDDASGALAPAVRHTLDRTGAGSALKDVLHGVWLRHPLHPVLTDVPIGAWTTAVVLDAVEASGRPEYGPGADASIAVGIAGAAGAALSGLADWSETDGRARRTGLLHGLLNVAATTLFAASWLARRRNRATGRSLARVGFGVSMAAAYLGGNLVFSRQIGVDHTANQVVPDEFVPVMRADDLAEGEMQCIDVHGTHVLLARYQGRVHAMADTCAHLGGPLSEGSFENGVVVCPWHGSRYSVEDGRVLGGPSSHRQPAYDVRIAAGRIEIRSPR